MEYGTERQVSLSSQTCKTPAARIDQMIDRRHPLVVLSRRMPWAQIEASLAPLFAHKNRSGQHSEHADLFGTSAVIAGWGTSHAGRPRLPLRLRVSLLTPKHAFNLSDEELVERWSANLVWQYFSGQVLHAPSPL